MTKLLVVNLIILCVNIRFARCFNYEDNVVNSDDYDEYDSKYTEPENCICVPYYQCKEDFSGLVEDGVDIMDVRISGDPSVHSPKPIPGGADAPRPLGQAKCGDVDVCCPIECGRTYNDLPQSYADESTDPLSNRMFNGWSPIANRITDDLNKAGTIRGNTARFAEFPWMLGVLQGKVYRCGASLIHPQVAVTAAHCVSAGTAASAHSSGQYIVRAGEWNWESASEPMPHQDRTTKKVIIHSHYHAPSLRNDIALLILGDSFKLAANVAIACLAPRPPQANTAAASQHQRSSDSVKCVVSGWGKNGYRNGVYQATLKKMLLPLVDRKQCVYALRAARLGPWFRLDRSFVCAGGEEFKDTCKGDGGSPLMCPIAGAPGRYEQVGVVSWGLTCGAQNTPGVYVNVGLFANWIDTNMRSNNFDTSIYRHKSIKT